MEAILGIILSYMSIWAPSLIAILGIAATVIGAIAKVRAAIADTKKANEELRSNETIKQMEKKFEAMAKENAELVHTNKLLLEQLTKIKGYADLKKED